MSNNKNIQNITSLLLKQTIRWFAHTLELSGEKIQMRVTPYGLKEK